MSADAQGPDPGWSHPSAAALVGVALSALAFYPGFLNRDSEWQLAQAMSGEYTDFYPVVMSVVWRALLAVFQPEAGMFLLVATSYWTGLAYLVAGLPASPGWRVAATLALGLWPPAFMMVGQIGKDAVLASALLLALGALGEARRRRSSGAFLLAVLAMSWGAGVRFNALPALLPICVLAGRIAPEVWSTWPRSRWGGRLATLSLSVALLGAPRLVPYAVDAKPGWTTQTFMLHDVVGVSLRSGVNWLPAFYSRGRAPLTLGDLRHPHVFSHYAWNPLAWNICDRHAHPRGEVRRPGFLFSAEDHRALVRAWLAALWAHPGAYLLHRLQVFVALLGIDRPEIPGPVYWFPPEQDIIGDRGVNLGFRRWTLRLAKQIEATALCRTWPYALALLLLAPVVLRRADSLHPFAGCVALSGILYLLGYFPTAPDTPFRYNWWTMTSAVLTTAFVLAPTGDPGGERADPQEASEATQALPESAGEIP